MHGKKKRIVRIFSFSKQQQRFDELNEFLIVRYAYWGKKERKKKELIRLFVSYTNREIVNFPRRFIFTNIFQITNLNFSTGEKFVGIEIARERERETER